MTSEATTSERSRPARVLFDGRALSDPHSRDRGFGVFARALLTELGEHSDVSIHALVRGGTELPPGIVEAPVHRLREHRFSAREHDSRLPFEIARRKPDVFHSPGLEPPIFCRSPWVQTLHDLTPLTFEHPFFRAERTRWRHVFARMKRATIIVAVSRSTADAAVRLLDIDPERIEVIPNGVDRRFHPRTEPYRPETPYLLSVGVYGPHKGYAEAFAVIDMLARRGYPHRLKIVGTLNDWRRGQINRLLASVEHRDRIDLLGFVDDEQLRALYRDAAALIMTSRSEGFGLPVVEAMASGTPVLAFANTSLPEVAGDAGLLVQDGDVAGIADRVAELLDDPSLALRLREAGLVRAGEFDWKAVADRYAAVYLRAAAGKR